jgi:DNA-binding Lrp family transcriptional regulator
VFKMPHLRGWSLAAGRAWLPAIGRHEVLVADAATWQETGRVAVKGQPVFVMASPDGRQVWVNFAFPDNGWVQVIDTLSGKVVQTLQPGKAVLHMEFTPRGEAVWISARDDNRVVIYDTRNFGNSADARRGALRHLLHQSRRTHRFLTWTRPTRRSNTPCSTTGSATFPSCAQPFAELRQKSALTRRRFSPRCKRLQARGAISRVGAVLAPRRIGASTLAALAAPAAEIEEIAALVSARPEVNHNYQREHRYNLWFVATAADQAALDRVLARDRARYRLCRDRAAAGARISHRPRLRPELRAQAVASGSPARRCA